jgi:tetratricopeptide (TPR) repeat protein
MGKNIKPFFLFFLFFPVFALSAQSNPSPQTGRIESPYYEVISDTGEADAEALARELEGRFIVYNRLFRFNPGNLTAPLKVRAFKDKEDYDRYVSARVGENRPGAVYFHYNQIDRRELVVHRGGDDEGRLLPHQAFVQFLRAFIPNPPAWLREGFSIYFSTLTFNGITGALEYDENLAWLETVKNLRAGAPSPESVLLADIRGIPEYFQSVSWALVSFFLNSGEEDYFRTITDSFAILSPPASAAENCEAVFNHISLWTDLRTLEEDYRAYIAARKTFTELLEEGQQAYAARDPITAELAFMSALNQKPAHYAPYYYLGLLSYEEKNYDIAEHYYRSAMQYGADPALVTYALGINAAAAGRREDAVSFLEQAAAASPERYRQRAADLIARIRQPY